jgi:hypothetical protein
MATPFDADLSRLADLTDEELATLEEGLTAEFEKADAAGDEAVMSELADALDAVLTEKQRRAAPAAEGEQAPPVAAAAEVTEAPTPEPEQESVAADPEPVAEAEEEETEQKAETADPAPETAEAETSTPPTEGNAQVTQRTAPPTEVPEDRKPIPVAASAVAVAGADIPGTPAGTVFQSRRDMNKAYADRLNTLRRLTGGDGEQVIIASLKTTTDDAHTLLSNDPEGNAEKIRRATDPNTVAITAAAGDGWCAPLTTKYDIFGTGDKDRPVRDGLPGFNADRGGVRYYGGFTLAQVAGAIGIWDDSKDPATQSKPVGTVACPTEKICEIYAVTRQLKFSNIGSRMFPEMVDAINDLSLVAHARVAESNLLAGIKAGSTAMAGPSSTVGTIRQVLNDVSLVAAYYRDRNRIAPETPMRTILPSWLIEAARVDITSTGPDKELIGGLTVSEINGFFADRNISVTWALDSSAPGTNGGGFYAAATTTVPATPVSLQYPVFAEGAWVVLDGGVLDLGVVRDSTLVSKNEYIQFAETFENVCNLGGPSLWITSDIDTIGCYNAGKPCVPAA